MMSKSASTMTTDTSTGNAAEPPIDAETTAAGLPDADTLTRWAREFFGALPVAADAPAPAAVAAAVSTAAKAVPQLPSATLERLTALDLVHPLLPEVPVQVVPTALPANPGIDSLVPTASPSFYFLEEATTRAPATPRHPPFNVHAIRRDFPILQTRVHGRQLVWFDNAATTQKPAVVIDRLTHFYRHENSNVHRAAHELAARATDAYEAARRQAQQFIGAASPDEIVFVRGTTEGINLVAQSFGRKYLQPGDDIVISHLEHHANIVPWQLLAGERSATLKVVPVDSSGQVRLDELQRLVTERTRLVSVTHVANALGTITPIREIVDIGHRAGARVLIDAAQSVSHIPINVQTLDADFLVFSGHKIYGPTGIGVLYGKRAVLEGMPPWQGGGSMIEDVTFESTRYQSPPARFEAGTGNIADAAGLGAALEYVSNIGLANIERYESGLLGYATERLTQVPGLTFIGTAPQKASVLSFVIDGLETTAIGSALNEEGIAVRAGHHCAQPILRRFGHEATVRASLAFYNTCEEVDLLVAALRRLTATSTRHRR
jgi:cysteine desulfurase / selenocysteine lyase